MRLHHLALARTSEAASDRFFVDLLGLEKRREKSIDTELCGALFGVGREHRLIDYGGEGVQFEWHVAIDAEGVTLRALELTLKAGERAVPTATAGG